MPEPEKAPTQAEAPPIQEVGTVQNPPTTEGGAAPDPVQELVDAAKPAVESSLGPALSPGQPAPAAEPAAEPAQAAEPPAAEPPATEPSGGPQQPETTSFAELAEQERLIRQRGRALDVRHEQIRAREAQLEQAPRALTREERLEQLRSNPAGYLQQEYGVGLQELAEAVAGGTPVEPGQGGEIAHLREQLAQTQERLQQFEQQQTQAVTQAQHAAAVGGIAQALEASKESYPYLVGMLGSDKAAEAIVQGVTQSYTQDGFKTADEVAAELEANLKPIADRLIAAHPKPTETQSPSPQPPPSPRLSNESSATPATPQGPRTRAQEIEDAAASLKFVGE